MTSTQDELAQRAADSGFDVYERGGALIVDVPNPRITDDDYFHGDNPHQVGFGSRGAAAEGAIDGDLTADGRSTADVQNEVGGAGWNQEAGAIAATSTTTSGRPDTSTRNVDIEAFAEREGIDLGDASTKADMLAQIEKHYASLEDTGEHQTDEE